MEDRIKISLEEDTINMIRKYFEEYKARQDLITMLFELHKFDEDSALLDSKPFLAYEKKFAESKVAYDTMMEEIRNTFIPIEYQTDRHNFTVDFNDNCIYITSM